MATDTPTVTTADELERELRTRLRGRSLVFELGADFDDFKRFRKPLFDLLRDSRLHEIERSHPALLAVYIPLAGVFNYEGGELWSKLHPGVRHADNPGATWLQAIRRLRLEPFDRMVEEDNALQWLGRFLAHGGIPKSGLDAFVELIAKEVDAGTADGTELLARWRAEGAGLHMLLQPTRRFLLFGGAPAVDLVDRCIELLRDRARLGHTPEPHEIGLPSYVVEAFERADTPERRNRRAAAVAAVVATPAIELDPYDALGPRVALPTVAGNQLGGQWRVAAGGSVTRVEPSDYTRRGVRISAVPDVEVEFLTHDGLTRRWNFELLGANSVLTFDPQSRVMHRGSSIAADRVWLLVPTGATVCDGSGQVVRQLEALPRPSGDWAGFDVLHLDLDGVDVLRVADAQAQQLAVLPVSAPAARPSVDGQEARGVTSAADAPVYTRPPILRLPGHQGLPEIAISARGQDHEASVLVDPASTDGSFDLRHVLPNDPFGDFVVRIRGALGYDLRERFAIVPGLEIKRPAGIVMPSARDATVEVRAPHLSVAGQPLGEAATLSVDAAEASLVGAEVSAPDGRKSALRITVPRLLWTVVHDTKPALELARHRVRISAEEFEDHLADSLLVHIGQPGVPLRLQLIDRHDQVLGELPTKMSAGSRGRWAFDLGPFAGAIREASGARLTLRLHVGNRSADIADVVRGLRATGIRAVAHDDGVRVHFVQTAAVQDRVLRLWSMYRPWMPAVEASVPDDASLVDIPSSVELPPGPYLAEVGVDDPWVTAGRPPSSAPNVGVINVGTREDALAWLQSLPPDDPPALLARALGRTWGESTFEIEALEEHLAETSHCLAEIIDGAPAGQLPGKAQRAIMSIVGARDSLLLRSLRGAGELLDDDVAMTRLDLRFGDVHESVSDPVDEDVWRAAWRLVPGLASGMELPWFDRDDNAADRCRKHLAWEPAAGPPEVAGAKVGNAELNFPTELLRDLRFNLALKPSGQLDPATRQLATFRWLMYRHECAVAGRLGPDDWVDEFHGLLDDVPCPEELCGLVNDHLAARRGPRGTFRAADAPAVLLAAAAHFRWGTTTKSVGLSALEQALPWAVGFVRADQCLINALQQLNRQ